MSKLSYSKEGGLIWDKEIIKDVKLIVGLRQVPDNLGDIRIVVEFNSGNLYRHDKHRADINDEAEGILELIKEVAEYLDNGGLGFKKSCEKCGEPFTPKNNKGKFCSDKCRVYSGREKDELKSDIVFTPITDNAYDGSLNKNPLEDEIGPTGVPRSLKGKKLVEMIQSIIDEGVKTEEVEQLRKDISISDITEEDKEELLDQIKYF